MSRVEALKHLLSMVEAGELDGGFFSWGLWPENLSWDTVSAAHRGSLDAAKSLHEAVLPGWSWAVDTLSLSASVYSPGYPGEDFEALEYSAENPIPARAWLVAILKALIAQEEASA